MAEYLIRKETLDEIAKRSNNIAGKTGRVTLATLINDLAAVGEELANQSWALDEIVRLIYKQNPTAMFSHLVERSIPTLCIDDLMEIPSDMFASCRSMIAVSSPSVINIGSYAFQYCASLVTADFPAATTIGYLAFAECKSLVTANFPEVTTLEGASFFRCESLTSIDLPFVTSIGSSEFAYCSALVTVDIPTATTIEGYAFENCVSLVTINCPLVTSIIHNAFAGCRSLTTIDLPSVTELEGTVFANCSGLTSLILRTDKTVCAISKDLFGYNTTYRGYIYVPSALLEAYRTDPTWSTFSSRLRAIEDHPDICGE